MKQANSRILPAIIAATGLLLGTAANAATFTLEFTSTTHSDPPPEFGALATDDADDYQLGETFVTTLNLDTDLVGPLNQQPPNFDLVQSATIFRALTGEIFDIGNDVPAAYLSPQARNGEAILLIVLDPVNFNENAIFVDLRASLAGANQPTTIEGFFDLYLSPTNAGQTSIEFFLGGNEPILGLESEDIVNGFGFVNFYNDLTAATLNGVAVNISPVPLPAGGLLLLGALLGAAGLRRKG